LHGLLFLLLLLERFVIEVVVVGHHPQRAGDDRRGQQPGARARVPRLFALHRRRGRFHRSESRGHAQPQLPIPVDDVEMALAGHLAPQREYGHEREQELEGVRES
jgi:hypothetical protein